MASKVYQLNTEGKSLTYLGTESMNSLGFFEVSDLEAWLASCRDQLFSREILWLMRQDRASDNQRSDIVGVSDHGDLVIVELKRGNASQDAITQILAYAAEYEGKNPDDLAKLYFDHSQKSGPSSLVEKAATEAEAQTRISNCVGENEVNKSQILIILAEGFDDRILSICEYIRRSVGASTFLMELWQYAIHPFPATNLGAGGHIFLLEQILPPSSIRARIEAEREAAKSQKRARDPKRMEFIRALQSYLSETETPLTRASGASYVGNIEVEGFQVEFSVPRRDSHAYLSASGDLRFDGDCSDFDLTQEEGDDGNWRLTFNNIDADNLNFDNDFGDRLVNVLTRLKPIGAQPQ